MDKKTIEEMKAALSLLYRVADSCPLSGPDHRAVDQEARKLQDFLTGLEKPLAAIPRAEQD